MNLITMVPATARFIAQMRGMRRHIVANNVTEFAVFQNWCDENNERWAEALDSGWHDAVTEEHYICNQCGADITSDPWGHINNSLMNGGNCGSYHSTYVTVKQGYYETVTDQAAYDEQVQVRDAWDETVTTGYKCSSCGATK